MPIPPNDDAWTRVARGRVTDLARRNRITRVEFVTNDGTYEGVVVGFRENDVLEVHAWPINEYKLDWGEFYIIQCDLYGDYDPLGDSNALWCKAIVIRAEDQLMLPSPDYEPRQTTIVMNVKTALKDSIPAALLAGGGALILYYLFK